MSTPGCSRRRNSGHGAWGSTQPATWLGPRRDSSHAAYRAGEGGNHQCDPLACSFAVTTRSCRTRVLLEALAGPEHLLIPPRTPSTR